MTKKPIFEIAEKCVSGGNHKPCSISRRSALLLPVAAGVTVAANALQPALDKLSSVLSPNQFATGSGSSSQAHAASAPAGFEFFNAHSPNARPSFLSIDWDSSGGVNGQYVPTITEQHCSAYHYGYFNWPWMTGDPDSFYTGGLNVWMFGMDNPGNWFKVTWNSVGSYYGRRVGCHMTVSEPSPSNHYNEWGRADGWEGNQAQNAWGTRRFFIVAPTFSSWRSHWLVGLSKVRQTYEFFYTDDPSKTPINLDQAYYFSESVQADGGGHEWASPGRGWKGHAFVPDGVSSQCVWANDLYGGWNTVATLVNEISDRTKFAFDFSGTQVDIYRGDTVGMDGYYWSFQNMSDFFKLTLRKSSADTAVTNVSASYSLKGAVYGVYTDAACTSAGKVGQFVTDANGYAILNAVNGTSYLPRAGYYVKEITPSPGYSLDTRAHYIVADRDQEISMLEQPKICTVVYYSDNKEVYRETWPIGLTKTPNAQATKLGTKPDCTPGFTAWYLDQDLTKKVTSFKTIDGEIKLYGKNKCTLQRKVTSSSDVKYGDALYRRPADSKSDAVRWLWPDFSSKQFWYGTSVNLGTLTDAFEMIDDSVTGVPRWLTLRCSAWSLTDPISASLVTSIQMNGDKTVWCEWRYAASDGVIDDRDQ